MDAAQGVLLVVGAVFEFLGIVLIAFPDLLPGAMRFANWLRPRLRAIGNRIRRLMRRPPRTQTVELSGIASSEVTGRASLETKINPAASLEEKVTYLLNRAQEAQRDLNAIRDRVQDLEEEGPRQLEALREQMESHVETEITAVVTSDRPLRVAGT